MDNTARVCIVSNTSYYVCSTSPCILEQFDYDTKRNHSGARERMRLLRPRPLACGPVGGGVVNLRVLGWAMDSSMSRLTAGRLDACL